MTREVAIETLKANYPDACFGQLRDAVDTAISALKQPEIIHCKECENWDMSWGIDYAPNYHYCHLVDSIHRGDFYCADAERRTNEQDD